MIPQHLSPDRFADAVAMRLDRVVPAGLSVRSDGSDVTLHNPELWGGSSAADILTDDDGRSVVELVETAARAIMSSIQDAVMESTHEPWPTGSANGMPNARVVGEHLRMWFGDEGDPVLRLDSVDLNGLAIDEP